MADRTEEARSNRRTPRRLERLLPLPAFLTSNSLSRGVGDGNGDNASRAAPSLRQLQVDGRSIRNDEAHARNRSAQSTTSRSSISTQPVVVRTYSRSRSRHPSSTRADAANPDNDSADAAAMTAEIAPAVASLDPNAKLPPIDDFKFDLILRAVEPDIHSTIDAIAEICARSRLSLADEYGAHLPPFTHTMPSMPRTRPPAAGPSGNGRSLAHGSALTTVPETSSSSEHSAPSTASGKMKMSAYASLAKLKQRSGRTSSSASKEAGWKESTVTSEEIIEGGGVRQIGTQNSWPGKGFTQPLIIRVAKPKVSREVAAVASDPGLFVETPKTPSSVPLRRDNNGVVLQGSRRLHERSKSWFPWPSGRIYAEDRLKDLLKSARTERRPPG